LWHPGATLSGGEIALSQLSQAYAAWPAPGFNPAARLRTVRPMTESDQLLRDGMTALGLEVDARASQLLAYLELIERWNRVYNLTAIRGREAGVVRHLLDSLAVLPHLPAGRVADLGSGAGLPGIVFAIWAPLRSVVLVESNMKKARFLRLVARELGLAGVEVVQARAETLSLQPPCDWLSARACASLPELLRLGGRWLRPGGRLLAMKGRYPTDEIALLPPEWRMVTAHRLQVPFLDEERHLIEVGRVARMFHKPA
jgi:16S rRNA (guanine527-N7)-methyltransferase